MDKLTEASAPEGEKPAVVAHRGFSWWRLAALLGVLAVLAAAAVHRWQRHYEIEAEIISDFQRALTSGPADSGFDLSTALIPSAEIYLGRLPKDGIAALINPRRVSPAEMTGLAEGDRVVGVQVGGQAVAYPMRLLSRHECVNDVVDGVPVAVTYSPWCDAVAVLDRRVGHEPIEFHISGRHYNGNILLFDPRPDEEGESLWSQIQFRAVTGPMAGQALRALPFEIAPWPSWRAVHPDGQVVAFPDPPQFFYDRNPYEEYLADGKSPRFPVSPRDDRLPPKEHVLGLATGGDAVAVPLASLEGGEHRVSVGGGEAVFTWDPANDSVRIASLPPDVRATHAFWFAWASLHPGSALAEQGTLTAP